LNRLPEFDASEVMRSGTRRYGTATLFRGGTVGFRIYSGKADFDALVREAEQELPHFKVQRVGRLVAFTRGNEWFKIMRGRSVITQLKGGRGRYVVDVKHARRFNMPVKEVEGWVTIDHEWNHAEPLARPLGRKVLGPLIP
jgi:hypothetical protein